MIVIYAYLYNFIGTKSVSFVELVPTLLGIITVGLFTTGKNKNRGKYGRIPQNPPH